VSYATQPATNASLGGELVYYAFAETPTVTETEFTAVRHLKGTREGSTSLGVYSIQTELYTFADTAVGYDSAGRILAPKLGDWITRDGDDIARVITSVDGSPWLKFWKVEAAYPSLAAALRQTAIVYRPAPMPDAVGLRTANLAAVYSAIPCRLQPGPREFEDEAAGRRTTRATFTCIFASAVLLKAGDVIEVASVRYEATGQQEVESLGVLTFAACERIS